MSPDSLIKFEDGVKKIIDTQEKYAFYWIHQSFLVYLLNQRRPCDLTFPWKQRRPDYVTMAFPKTSPYLPFFKKASERLREKGVLSKLGKKWLAPNPKCPPSPVESLSLYKVATVFFLWLAVNLVVVIIFLMECLLKKNYISATKEPELDLNSDMTEDDVLTRE
jgi:hypothetical protein